MKINWNKFKDGVHKISVQNRNAVIYVNSDYKNIYFFVSETLDNCHFHDDSYFKSDDLKEYKVNDIDGNYYPKFKRIFHNDIITEYFPIANTDDKSWSWAKK